MTHYEVIWFRNWIRMFIFCHFFKSSLMICCSSLFQFFFSFHFIIRMMSISLQMSLSGLWMILNRSDSETELRFSSCTNFSNVPPFFGLFLKWIVLCDSVSFLVLIVFLSLRLSLLSFPKWVVSSCKWLRKHLIQMLNKNFILYQLF